MAEWAGKLVPLVAAAGSEPLLVAAGSEGQDEPEVPPSQLGG